MSRLSRTQLRIKEIEYVDSRKTNGNNTILKQFAHIIQYNPNVNHSYDVDVKTLCKQGRLKEALDIVHNMGIALQSSAYVCLLQGCIRKKSLSDGKGVHSHMEERGFTGDMLSNNTLLNMYVKCGSLVDARRVFDQMTERDVCSWTIMIAAYARHGPAEEALALFRQMHSTGVQPDPFAFSGALSACSKLVYLEQGVEIHQEIIRRGFESNLSVANALLDMYGKCGEIDKARQLFGKMHQRDIVSWTAIIAGYTQGGLVDEALDLFREMPYRDAISWNAMIAGFARNGFVDKAFKLFKEMPEPNVASWNAMITGFAQKGFVDKALRLFNEMPQRDVVSWNAMIAGYAQNGFVNEALEFFQAMPQPNLVSWNAIISGFTQNGHGEKALKLFRQMELVGVRPNSKTYASILPACAKLAALDQGIEIHEKTISSGCQYDVFVMTALVDMYAQCGSIEKARELFDKLHPRAVVSWNAMIGGYAMNGRGKEALELFEKMKQSGMTPDHITLVSVLSACSHAGLVDEGYFYFNYMREHYHITPAIEHYVCMVDLLGRAGRLDEAKDLIIRMPIKPDSVVWICLLSACRIHNNLRLAKIVAEHIFEFDPENTAPYVLLSNIYATLGRWGDIEKVRKMMRNQSIIKTPGCSWIEVNKQVHAFLEGDTSHQQMHKIYGVGETALGDESSSVCSRYKVCIE